MNDSASDRFARLEIVPRDRKVDSDPLLKIRFSPAVHSVLGQGAMPLVKAMIEAVAQQISDVVDAGASTSKRPDVLH